MTEDVILDVTADFIRSSATNLKLALQVERAMPHVRKHLIKAALVAVEECFPRMEWTMDRSAAQDVVAKGASLALRRKSWITNQGDAAIWLGTNQPYWKDVWIGLYFGGQSSQKLQPIEQTVAPLTNRGFCFEASEDQPGVWKHLDGELRDWSDERFLTRILDDGPNRIASEISAELNTIEEFVRSLPQGSSEPSVLASDTSRPI